MSVTEANKQIAQSWISAFNRHNLDDLVALYSADAVHHSPKLQLRLPETQGKISGKAALQSWWADAFERLPSLHYSLQNLIADEERVLIEYKRIVENEPGMMVAEILEIKDGLIIKSRVYHG